MALFTKKKYKNAVHILNIFLHLNIKRAIIKVHFWIIVTVIMIGKKALKHFFSTSRAIMYIAEAYHTHVIRYLLVNPEKEKG